MLTGIGVKIVALGVVLCGLFAFAFYFGGGVAFAISACGALLLTFMVAYWASRSSDSLKNAVSSFVEGGDADVLRTVSGELSESFFGLSEEFSKRQDIQVFYEKALIAAGIPMVLCGPDGKIVAASKALQTLLKKPESKVVGKTVNQAFCNRGGSSIVDDALKAGHNIDDTVTLELWDGRSLTMKAFGSVFFNDDGQVSGVVASFFSLDEVVQQQNELQEQRARMAEAGQKVSDLAEHVASSTELLSAAAEDQAQGAQRQRNQTSSVATAMEEMTATVIEVAQNATATSDAAGHAQSSAAEGVAMVNKAVDAINNVSESTRTLGHEVSELDSQAAEIGRIINVINDIADQTNLLALNAAIEAARAGEAGRGFAVVADEVRKLAEKTVAATKDVEEAIVTIQKRSSHATSSMRETEVQVEQSTDLSNKAGQALQQIMEDIQDMVNRVAQIATAAEQQSAAAEEINHSIEEIAVIAGDADEAAGQAASATRDLAGLAQGLLDVSMGFRDGKGDALFRESDGEMKGVLPKLAQQFVQTIYGDDVYASMQADLGEPVFLPAESYPDQVLSQMAEFAAGEVGISVRDFFLGFGRFTVGKFYDMYPVHFKDESLKQFYLRMNDVHAQLTKDQSGINPPTFTYEDKGDDLFMNYRSKRGLFDYFEGILLGAAEFKKERVTVNVKPFDEETARAEIVFHGKQ